MIQQLSAILFILLPLFVGFCISFSNKKYMIALNRIINFTVNIILLLIGVSLSHLSNANIALIKIPIYAAIFLCITLIVNGFCIAIFDKYFPWKHLQQSESCEKTNSFIWQDTVKQLGIVAIGWSLGKLFPPLISLMEGAINYLLMLLLLLIGIQLRSSGIKLHQVLLNKRGVVLAILSVIATLIGAIIAGMIIGIPILQSLALGSGFGWYSLSGSVLTHAYGAFWGTVALLNDLGREIFALIFIPTLMKRYPSVAISTGGATAIDFTLPTILRSGGVMAVPFAVSYSFIINVLSPILMIVFSGKVI